MEQFEDLENDDFVDVTPLWLAAANGHLEVVKVFVEAGANVNYVSQYEKKSTPVRAACYYGHLDVVKYLADHGADLNEPRNTRSCLMIACAKGHLDIVKFLLEKGVDVYQTEDSYGSSAMHFAARRGRLDIVKLLVNSGVKMQVDSNGMNPLMLAAVKQRIAVVEFILVHDVDVTKEEKIDALELLGASFANNVENPRLDLCFQYLSRAMLLRFEDPNELYPKNEYAEVNPAYGQRVECKNLNELEEIREDSYALHMESLMIWERILGQYNEAVAKSVMSLGEVYAGENRFEKCIPLYVHGLYLHRINEYSISEDLLQFSQVFLEMYNVNIPIQFDYMKTVLEAALGELARLKVKTPVSGNDDDDDNNNDDDNNDDDDDDNQLVLREETLIHTLYLISVMTKMKNSLSLAEIDALEQLIYNIVKVGAVTRDGYTLLHLSVGPDIPMLNWFPCADTVTQLIKCGADVNAMDNNRNTPLHIIVSSKIPVDAENCLTVQTIVSALLDANCHYDMVNRDDLTPTEVAAAVNDPFGVTDILKTTPTKYRLNLKCLTSRVISTCGIPYVGIVPKEVEEYIELHNSGR